MRMAVVGPLSPYRTGVAQFSENLAMFLAERCDIKLYSDACTSADNRISRKIATAPISDLYSEAGEFDTVLYHMGNHYRYHRSVFEALWRIPGIVLLHDCVLNHFFAKYALEKGNFGVFRRLFGLCYDDSGAASRFIRGDGDPYEFPMAGVVARRSRGVIIMSEYGAEIVRRESPGTQTVKISFPHFSSEAGPRDADGSIGGLELAPERFVVAAFGHITPAKRIDVAIAAFARFEKEFPDAVFLLAGEESPNFPIQKAISQQASKNIHYLGYLDDEEAERLLLRADVCINLRYPSNGEMSASLMRMLGLGKVVIVSNYAQFAEFPDSTCIKIDVGPGEVDALAGELVALARDEERCRRIGGAARDHVSRRHGPEEAADAIVAFARENSSVEPQLSDKEIEGVLYCDNLLLRRPRMIVYNGRRLVRRAAEQGIATAVRQALSRAPDRT